MTIAAIYDFTHLKNELSEIVMHFISPVVALNISNNKFPSVDTLVVPSRHPQKRPLLATSRHNTCVHLVTVSVSCLLYSQSRVNKL